MTDILDVNSAVDELEKSYPWLDADKATLRGIVRCVLSASGAFEAKARLDRALRGDETHNYRGKP